MRRLKERLDDAGFGGIWVAELGYVIRLGSARAVFLSAEETANVVGNTAHLLLEVDESQDVSREKYNKDFRPMAAATNCTTVHYGTTWDEHTLLEEIKQTNLELARKDGRQRHFRYDWQEVAKYNPDYRAYVEQERARLGENHPLFMTQYRLLPVRGGGGLLNLQQLAQLRGDHDRRRQPEAGKTYVAGLDLAGESPDTPDSAAPQNDATVLTIGEIDYADISELAPQPRLKVVEHYRWVGENHAALYPQMVDILKRVWRCRRVVIDATGLGQPVSSFLRRALGSRVVPFTFTANSKSRLGFNLLAAVNSGQLKMYRGDGSVEYREFWTQLERAQSHYRTNQTMNFFVPERAGHDDALISLALLVEAAHHYSPRSAHGS